MIYAVLASFTALILALGLSSEARSQPKGFVCSAPAGDAVTNMGLASVKVWQSNVRGISLEIPVRQAPHSGTSGFVELRFKGSRAISNFQHRVDAGKYVIELFLDNAGFPDVLAAGGVLQTSELDSESKEALGDNRVFFDRPPSLKVELPNLTQALGELEKCSRELEQIYDRDFCARSVSCDSASWRLVAVGNEAWIWADERSVRLSAGTGEAWILGQRFKPNLNVDRYLALVKVDCASGSATLLREASLNVSDRIIEVNNAPQPQPSSLGLRGVVDAICANQWKSPRVQSPKHAMLNWAAKQYADCLEREMRRKIGRGYRYSKGSQCVSQ